MRALERTRSTMDFLVLGAPQYHSRTKLSSPRCGVDQAERSTQRSTTRIGHTGAALGALASSREYVGKTRASARVQRDDRRQSIWHFCWRTQASKPHDRKLPRCVISRGTTPFEAPPRSLASWKMLKFLRRRHRQIYSGEFFTHVYF